MNTTTHNRDRIRGSIFSEVEHYKAVDELFSQLGNKANVDPAVPDVRQSAQLLSPSEREPLTQRSAVPLSQRHSVSAIYVDHDEPTWVDRLQQVMLVSCLVVAAMASVKAIPASWFGSDNRASAAGQTSQFRELVASGRPNTLAEHARIAREALIAGGLSKRDARHVVEKALKQLQSWGITAPGSHIPWGG